MEQYLDFEQPIYTCLEKIEELKKVVPAPSNLAEEIALLEDKADQETQRIYKNLSSWQKVLVARHPNRPHTKDYLENVFNGFEEIHGDRLNDDDMAIVGGFAFLDNYPVVVIGHEKGRETEERVSRNFGMPHPSGFRKANRLMKLAEKFTLPVITLIDTPGAYPGVKAEHTGQHEAIAKSLEVMSDLKTPIINLVIGEGGSGGGFGIGLADKIGMLEYSIYSVASPEACASILWRTAKNAEQAADALKLDASSLKELDVIDLIIDEPIGGAHRNHEKTYQNVKKYFLDELKGLSHHSIEDLTRERYKKFADIGV
ncbi:MAG: acetyl-CoA carboxylase carboxyltransferase subunit alpha [Rickettsiales bacterium TMED289]|nr:acetyl-CoA carboxylase carboxyl transferase subunit alpha [Gammaproteobacteria bacterium]RPF74736.1 MAG: acetyl-CoA carboxylase carboxyltransferase subunit alpha [Rickettsiales bacterium TMED289]|tara:strand:+ start:1488 stop:2429 length:942 start_codon:yes stop_codon:yes gene_type:complete